MRAGLRGLFKWDLPGIRRTLFRIPAFFLNEGFIDRIGASIYDSAIRGWNYTSRGGLADSSLLPESANYRTGF